MARRRNDGETEPVAVPFDQPDEEPALDVEKAQLRARVEALERLNLELMKVGARIEDDEFEKWKEWCGLSAQEKTQLKCKELFGEEGPCYRVVLRDNPEVIVPANSPEEARGRYDRLCGILRTENEYSITPIPEVAPGVIKRTGYADSGLETPV